MADSGVRICVTCVGGILIYDTMKGLRSAEDLNAWILGIDADGDAHGRLLCDAFAIVPNASRDGPAWFSAIRDLLVRERIDALLILSDAESRLVAPRREELRSLGIVTSVSSAATVERVTDKLALLTHLSQQGIDVGDFVAVDDREGMHHAAVELGFPARRVVVKPRNASGSRGVMILDQAERSFRALLPRRFCGTGDIAAVEAAMTAQGVSFAGMIAVPYYDGPIFDVDCISRDGEMIDACARLRQLRNPLSPTSTGHKIVLDERVIEYADRLARALPIDGAGDFDIILTDGNRPIVIDAGARFSGSIGGSVTAGANFPAQLIRVLLGRPTQPLQPQNGLAIRPYVTMAAIPANNADQIL